MADLQAASVRRLLLAVDNFRPSEEAVSWAKAMAQATGAHLDVATVIPKPPLAVRLGSFLDSGVSSREALRELDEQARRTLRGIRDRLRLDDISLHAGHGLATEALLAKERKLKSDLLVVGGRGTATIHSRLGSVADYMRHYARASVLIANQPPSPMKGIVAGTDGSPAGNRAVQMAGLLARHFACSLEVIQSREDATVSQAVDARHRNAAPLATLPQAKFVSTRMPPATALLDAAAGASLVVVGSRGLGPMIGSMIGSVSDRVSVNATCSVLIVR